MLSFVFARACCEHPRSLLQTHPSHSFGISTIKSRSFSSRVEKRHKTTTENSNKMKTTTSTILFLASLVSAKHAVHEHLQALHRRHHEHAIRSVPETAEHGVEVRAASPETATPEKRQAQCAFPYSAGLVPVTPGSQNAGWAMSPNQPCTPGTYCPYACPPGQVSMQWDPTATSYTYPKSMVSWEAAAVL